MTAFVLDLSRVTATAKPTTLDTQAPQQSFNPKCRCLDCTGRGLGWITHIQPKKSQSRRQSNFQERDHLCFDPATGEIIPSTYTTHPYDPAPYDYPEATQTAKPSTSSQWYHPDLDTSPDVAEIKGGLYALPNNVVDAKASTRGRKPTVKANQLASLLKVAHAEHRGWVDDHVYAACYIVAGDNNDRLNVSPAHILKAVLLDEISVAMVRRVIHLDGLRTMSPQQSRRICQCARFAVAGMELYLDNHPKVRKQLQYEVDFSNSYYDEQTHLKVEPTVYDYPDEIITLYNAGDYLAYGEALRDHRQGKPRV